MIFCTGNVPLFLKFLSFKLLFLVKDRNENVFITCYHLITVQFFSIYNKEFALNPTKHREVFFFLFVIMMMIMVMVKLIVFEQENLEFIDWTVSVTFDWIYRIFSLKQFLRKLDFSNPFLSLVLSNIYGSFLPNISVLVV